LEFVLRIRPVDEALLHSQHGSLALSFMSADAVISRFKPDDDTLLPGPPLRPARNHSGSCFYNNRSHLRLVPFVA